MSIEKNKKERLLFALRSAAEQEIAAANGIYEGAKKLETALLQDTSGKSLNDLDSCMDETLSGANRQENESICQIGQILNGADNS